MDWLHWLSGPLIGAVIGYFTNYIAVKMLFRPRRAIQLGNWKLPFTPGIIPKRKKQLAHAIGQAVGNQLFTTADVKELLLSDGMKQSVRDSVLGGTTEEGRTLEDRFQSGMGVESYERCKKMICQRLCGRLESDVRDMDLGAVIAEQGSVAIKEKVSGTMMAMFVHDRTITTLAQSIHSGIDRYLDENLYDILLSKIETEVNHLTGKTVQELCESVTADAELLQRVVERAYESVVNAKADQVLSSFHVSDVVEQKINEMDVAEMEQLVLSVMKNELRMIVNLGALIGFVIGIINIFVD